MSHVRLGSLIYVMRTIEQSMIEHKNAFYDTYSFIFDLPFPLRKKKNLFDGLVRGEPWAWRVIGITVNALMGLAQYDFKRTKDLPLRRAHFTGRMETAKEIFNAKIPRDQFFERFFKTDVTALALGPENTKGGPSEYIPIDPNLNLFSSTDAGFKHGPGECKYLRELHAAYKAGKVPLKKRPD